MKLIRTTEAAGQVLCHDVTQIIPGKFKGPAFKKGHIITEEDIPVLLSIGKENLYVWEKTDGILHEDEAAAILRDLTGSFTKMKQRQYSEILQWETTYQQALPAKARSN